MKNYRFPDHANLAVVGDWHGNVRWVSQLVNYLSSNRNITHIIHVGDFGIMGNTTGYLQCLEEATVKTGVTILFIRGNHDDPDYLNALPRNEQGLAPLHLKSTISPRVFFVPDGTYMTWRNKTILGIGGAVSIDQRLRHQGLDWWPNEVIPEGILDTVLLGLPEAGVDVLITHDTPAAAAVPLNPAFAALFAPEVVDECEDHRSRLQGVVDVIKPRNIIHGHYHVFYDEAFYSYEHDYATRCVGLECDKARFSATKAHRHWVNLADILGLKRSA